MTREVFRWDPQLGVYDVNKQRPKSTGPKRSHLSTPNIVFDNLGFHGIKSQADGKQYDSRSRYYRSLKEQGAHIVEHKAPKGFKPHVMKGSGSDIKRSIQELKSK